MKNINLLIFLILFNIYCSASDGSSIIDQNKDITESSLSVSNDNSTDTTKSASTSPDKTDRRSQSIDYTNELDRSFDYLDEVESYFFKLFTEKSSQFYFSSYTEKDWKNEKIMDNYFDYEKSEEFRLHQPEIKIESESTSQKLKGDGFQKLSTNVDVFNIKNLKLKKDDVSTKSKDLKLLKPATRFAVRLRDELLRILENPKLLENYDDPRNLFENFQAALITIDSNLPKFMKLENNPLIKDKYSLITIKDYLGKKGVDYHKLI